LDGATKSGESKVSPVSTVLKAQPALRYGGDINEQYDQNPARGTQFYDFYRDSGVVFRGGKL
jgi:hypothetical protein